jgi:hypothetical protein
MAAVSVDDLEPASRRVFVDAARWDAVVGDFVGSTSVAGAGPHMHALADRQGPLLFRSRSLQVEVTGIKAGDTGAVTVKYLSDKGYPLSARVVVDHVGTATGALDSCRVGCALLSVQLSGRPFEVSRVSAGGVRLLGSGSFAGGAPQDAATVDPGDDPVPSLATRGMRSSGVLEGIDGTSHPVQVVGVVGAVPFVGRAGSLLDLAHVLRGAVGTVAAARAVVIARADTPVSVLAQLRKDGAGRQRTYAAVADQIDSTPSARADSLAFLVAVGVGLVALMHLLAWLASQLGRRRTEVAGLRAAGIGPRAVRRAYLEEAALLAGVVLVAAAVAAAATTVPLLKPLRLVGGWAQGPELELAVRPLTLGTVVVGVALLTALLCGIVFTRFGRAARPAALRSADR